MEDCYIEEKTWVKCTIDGITYDCHFEYSINRIYSHPWVQVTVIKYVTKKWWIFRWKEEEFQCEGNPDLNGGEWIHVNKNLYFKSEFIKDWVKCALNRRELDIREKRLELEKQRQLKVLKEI